MLTFMFMFVYINKTDSVCVFFNFGWSQASCFPLTQVFMLSYPYITLVISLKETKPTGTFPQNVELVTVELNTFEGKF